MKYTMHLVGWLFVAISAAPAYAQDAESGQASGDGGPAVDAVLDWPSGVAVDRHGNVFIAARRGNRIRRVDGDTGLISRVVGNGKPRHPPRRCRDGAHQHRRRQRAGRVQRRRRSGR